MREKERGLCGSWISRFSEGLNNVPFVIVLRGCRDGHDSAREASRPRELADGRQGENGAECLPSKRGSSSALLSTRPAAASTIARAGPVFSLRPAGRFKRELQVSGPDSQDSRRGGQRRSQESLASSEPLPEMAVRAGGPCGESLPEDAQSLRHGEPNSVPDPGRQGAAAAAEADLPVHAYVLQCDSLLRELHHGADPEGGLVAVRHPDRAIQDQASRDVGHQDRPRVDQGGDIRRHVDLHASRVRTGTGSRSLQAHVDLHGDHMDVLFGNGKGFRRNVPNDPGLPAARSVGEYRESVRAGDTPLLYDRYVGDLQHSAVTVSLLEVPDDRYVSERVSTMEGADGKFRRGAATRTRGAESLQEGDPRGNREVR